MSFWQRLRRLFNTQARSQSGEAWFYLRCNRCGEHIRVRVDLYNHLSAEYGEGDDDVTYIYRKTVVGSGEKRCFQPIEIRLVFDKERRLQEQEIHGGQFITEEAYQAGAG
jgi:hypothetical protein